MTKNSMSREDGTVGKALYVLDIVAQFKHGARFNDILAQSPYPKASTYRFVQTLTNQRFLRLDEETQKYHLGLRLLGLAHRAWSQASLAPIAREALDALSAELGETVHLAQLDHAQVLYVDKRNAKRPIAMFSDAGKIGPAYCTGVGKAMLAFLPEEKQNDAIAQQSFYPHTPQTLKGVDELRSELREIREAGIAFDREEHELSIICVAVPILSEQGRVLGGISITSSTERSSIEGLEVLKPRLQNTAKEIARAASAWQFPQ